MTYQNKDKNYDNEDESSNTNEENSPPRECSLSLSCFIFHLQLSGRLQYFIVDTNYKAAWVKLYNTCVRWNYISDSDAPQIWKQWSGNSGCSLLII